MPDWDLLGQPEPDFEFDQRIGLVTVVSLLQETVQPPSSTGRSQRRRCSPQQPGTRAIAARAASVSLAGVC
jgi:hypothetical protein